MYAYCFNIYVLICNNINTQECVIIIIARQSLRFEHSMVRCEEHDPKSIKSLKLTGVLCIQALDTSPSSRSSFNSHVWHLLSWSMWRRGHSDTLDLVCRLLSVTNNYKFTERDRGQLGWRRGGNRSITSRAGEMATNSTILAPKGINLGLFFEIS